MNEIRHNNFSAVAVLVGVNVLFYFLQMMEQSHSMTIWLALWPMLPEQTYVAAGQTLPEFLPWQIVSYGFLHGGLSHLFFNMFGLWMFGREVEQWWGKARFLQFYFICLVGAGAVQLVVATIAAQQGSYYPTVGASGAVFGVLMAFAWMFPNRKIMLLIPPIPLKAKWFVLIYGGIELFLGVTGTQAGVAHFAHIGGLVFGLLTILYWRGFFPLKPKYIMKW